MEDRERSRSSDRMGERFDFSAANQLKSSLSDFPLHFLMMNEASCSKAPPKQPPRRLTVESSTQFAPGYRFHPTDEELVSYYLKRKVSGKRMVDVISEIELYKAEPWDLPARSRLQSGDLEWYFFTLLDRKYSNCCRTNRATRATTKGYWKTTGIDRPVQRGSRTIGKKKTLVYHAGRAPRGQRTNWVMHEYRLEDEDLTRAGIPQDGYVVCRIFEKNGPGPQNGAQYGAPFKEEEWEMEEEEEDAELVPVDVDRVDALLDHADPDFFTLEDFFQNPDTGYQNLDAFPSESRSAEHQFDSRTEDSSIFVDEILKALDSFDDRIPDADFSAPQSINSALNRLGEMEGPEDQSICASLQSNGYVQLEDIFVEDNPNPSSDACSNHCLWDIGHNHSVGDGISPSKSLFQKPVEEESCYTNCSLDQLQLCGTVQHDMFPQPFDSLDTVLWESPSAEDNSIFYDALNHEVPYSEGGFELETSLAPLADFELSEDLIAYYNASDDNLIYGSPNLLPSKFEQAYSLECIEPNDSLEVVGSSSSSYKEVLHENLVLQSSSGKPQTGDDFSSVLNDNLTDAELNEPQDKKLSKRLASMLNSISAPPAFADEAALIGKTARQVPAASGGELRLTVGRIQIDNWMAMDYSEIWTLRKHTDVGFYHSYGVYGSIVGKSGSHERRGKVLGGFYSTFCSDGFHLFFISAVILGLSCKIGQYICKLLGGLLE